MRTHLDGSNIFGPATTFVQSAEERNTAMGIMLPTIFSIQDDADERRSAAMNRLADIPDAQNEVIGRSDRVGALVVKADQIAQSMVAENNVQFMAAFGDLIRPVHSIRVQNIAAGIPADKPLSGMTQNFFIRRDPANAVLDEDRNHGLADGTFGGPHSGR